MAQPRGQKRIPGHQRIGVNGLAACECGWAAASLPTRWGIPWTPTMANAARGRHLADVRMAAAE